MRDYDQVITADGMVAITLNWHNPLLMRSVQHVTLKDFDVLISSTEANVVATFACSSNQMMASDPSNHRVDTRTKQEVTPGGLSGFRGFRGGRIKSKPRITKRSVRL